MRKILAVIDEEDNEKLIAYKSLEHTYGTLLMLEGYDLDKGEIAKKKEEIEKKRMAFWNKILDKYNVPLYADKDVFINDSDHTIYINE